MKVGSRNGNGGAHIYERGATSELAGVKDFATKENSILVATILLILVKD